MTQEDIDRVYQELAAYEKEIQEHNSKFLDNLGQQSIQDFEELMDCCNITEKIKFVEEPKGRRNNEDIGVYKDIHVDQWTTNMEGDSYSGFLYANINDKWIEVPYSC